jgi:hypothetical protein
MVLPVFKVKGPNDSVREMIKEAGQNAVERRWSPVPDDDSTESGVSEGRASSGFRLPSMYGFQQGGEARGSEVYMGKVVDAVVKGVVKPKLLCGVDQNHHISKWLRKHGRVTHSPSSSIATLTNEFVSSATQYPPVTQLCPRAMHVSVTIKLEARRFVPHS